MKIQYHKEARGPAINVKCYDLGRDAPDGTENQQESAAEYTASAWWDAADDIAKAHGFDEVFSCGRMGGWLYTSPLPENDEYPVDFIDDIEALLKQAPTMYAEILADIIAQDAANRLTEKGTSGLTERLALALENVSGKAGGEPCDCLDEGARECPHCEARTALADYRAWKKERSK